MRNPNGLRTVLLITPPLFLLFPISILVFVLERISYTLLTVQTTRNYRTDVESMTFYGPPGPNSTSDDYDYIDVDININNGPTGAIIGISVVAWLVSVVAVCGIWELRRVEGSARHQRWWSWTVLLSDLAIAIASIAVLAWASVVQGKEGWKGYQDVSKHDQRYTRETWVCQIDRFYSGNDWAGAACGISKATRFCLIPLAIAALLTIAAVWKLINDRGGIKWLFGGKGRYGGFDSVYELREQVPVKR